jgi:hypothetical protein
VTTEHERNGVLEAVDRIVNRGGDADDVLHETLTVLRRLYPYAAIRFDDEHEASAERHPIEFQGTKVADLEVAGTAPGDTLFLRRVTTLISAYCSPPEKMRSIFSGHP